MNILFISALPGRKGAGPTYSVPKQIKSQSKIDNVYWVNLCNVEDESIFDKDMFNIIMSKEFKVSALPSPFNKPDIIIFEEFFKMEFIPVYKEVKKLNIPYVIIPRCQMTEKYLINKRLKKIIASTFFFKSFAKNASSVQFLSKQESDDSKKFYKGNSYIAPNGIDLQENVEIRKYTGKQTGVFIGRYNVWQKGLDLLSEALSKRKDHLIKAGIAIDLYGPESPSGSATDANELVEKFGLKDIVSVNGAAFDKEKEEVLKKADFFIHTSRFEGMPMAVLEALSYGLPCLLTQGSNLREDLEKHNAGWGADTEVDSIVNAIDDMISNLDKWEEKSRNALNMAGDYSWEKIAQQNHNEYREIINGGINV